MVFNGFSNENTLQWSVLQTSLIGEKIKKDWLKKKENWSVVLYNINLRINKMIIDMCFEAKFSVEIRLW